MKKSILLALGVLFFSGCLKSVRYRQNPAVGKYFSVAFQEDKVSMSFGDNNVKLYSGSCNIMSNMNKVVTLIEIRNPLSLTGYKSSLGEGVIIHPGGTVPVSKCFRQAADTENTMQIIFKDGEQLYSDDLSVVLSQN